MTHPNLADTPIKAMWLARAAVHAKYAQAAKTFDAAERAHLDARPRVPEELRLRADRSAAETWFYICAFKTDTERNATGDLASFRYAALSNLADRQLDQPGSKYLAEWAASKRPAAEAYEASFKAWSEDGALEKARSALNSAGKRLTAIDRKIAKAPASALSDIWIKSRVAESDGNEDDCDIFNATLLTLKRFVTAQIQQPRLAARHARPAALLAAE